jgi:hypothetical protein
MAPVSLISLIAALLPALLQPAAPFPRIVQQAPTVESVARGVEYGDYQLLTVDGPLSVHVVAVAPDRTNVRVDSVLADDSLISRGETVGSMAKRTRAIAGINADYFDIGNTNRPVNMVVRAGALLQLPYKRAVLAITRDGMPHITEFTFSGQMVIADRTFPLDAIDQMPEGGSGLSLLTPNYGRVAPHENVTLATLQPLGGAPPLERYRVTGLADNLNPQPPGYYVAIGLNDYNAVGVPDAGSLVSVDGDLSPFGLASIDAAVGGGAMILHDGAWYDDPDAPYRQENARRVPVSGAAVAPDGRLFLIEVDGRQPELSIGLTRPEFSALMRSLGSTEGLLFDGGGSSTMVVRRLGDPGADVVNSPSDRKERPVADGIFVYSTAPVGAAVRLVARPGVVRAVPGAEVALRIAAVDAAYNVANSSGAVNVSVSPASLGSYRDGAFVAQHSGAGRLLLRDASLKGEIPVEVDSKPARTRISPARPNVDDNGQLGLVAQAFDDRGYRLELPPLLHWTSSAGSIDTGGLFRAGTHDANVSVRIGGTLATTRVTVGSHGVGVPFAQSARFVTAPRGGTGELVKSADCGSCVELHFSFSNGERAAYAKADIPLPKGTIGVEFDLSDDGSAARLRVAFRNEINEDVLVDAATLGEPGWRHVAVRFPPGSQAMRLISIYVLPPKGIQLSEGSIVLRNVRAIVAGH